MYNQKEIDTLHKVIKKKERDIREGLLVPISLDDALLSIEQSALTLHHKEEFRTMLYDDAIEEYLCLPEKKIMFAISNDIDKVLQYKKLMRSIIKDWQKHENAQKAYT